MHLRAKAYRKQVAKKEKDVQLSSEEDTGEKEADGSAIVSKNVEWRVVGGRTMKSWEWNENAKRSKHSWMAVPLVEVSSFPVPAAAIALDLLSAQWWGGFAGPVQDRQSRRRCCQIARRPLLRAKMPEAPPLCDITERQQLTI